MKMNKQLFAFIAETLREYPFYDNEIALIESEIRNVPREIDENVGGGKSSIVITDEPIINMMDKIAADKTIANIKHNQLIIQRAWASADDLTRLILNRLYFDQDEKPTTTALAKECHVDQRTISRKRTAFFEQISESLKPVNRF